MSKDESESENLVKNLMKIVEEMGEIEIDNVTLQTDELELILQPMVSSIVQSRPVEPLPSQSSQQTQIQKLLEEKFTPPLEKYPGQVVEVQIGAKKSEGGTRGSVVKIGGARTMPFYTFEAENPNRPVFAMDIFDMPIKLAKTVRMKYEGVMNDPAEWAKRCVEFGADVVSLNLVSTDPLLDDTSPQKAAKVVENVIQAVDVPIIIGGSGNKQKDPVVLEAAAEVAAGEKIVLNSANTDNDYKRIVEAANKYGHSVVAFTPMDINNQKKLNRMLLNEGLPKDRIIMDPTTAALGYGIDYSLSIMERIKMAGLLGDDELQMPILAPASNAWGAREAWMKNEELGPRELRGPLWETITTITIMMAGGDIFMTSHPATVRVVKGLVDDMLGKSARNKAADDWVTALG
jgi:acetyl-CoA decarbonylase/synthase complex subunit delta